MFVSANRFLIALFLLLSLTAGCDFLPSGSGSTSGDASSIIIDGSVQPDEYPDDGYRIMDVIGTDTLSGDGANSSTVEVGTVETDTLGLRIQYSGGCEKHDFQLVADDTFQESFPVGVRTRLFHDDNGDTCEALPTVTERFALAPLKELYENTEGGDSGVILLRFDLEREDDLVVRYEFGTDS